jgi:putative transposase
VTLFAKREAIAIFVTEHRLSISRACRIVGFSRTAHYTAPQDALERDGAVIAALQGIVAERPRAGFWKCFDRLRKNKKKHPWNHKRVYRVYRALRLNLPRRTKRRVPTRLRQPLVAPTELNKIWALDFMSDALYGGRKFRTLNVIDEANREALAVEVATSIPSVRVVRILDELVQLYGRPEALRMDNGPEFTAEVLREWCDGHGIDPRYIQPGKPDQNAFVERFNRSYREDVLDAYVFESVDEVRGVTEEWVEDYNSERPLDSLGGLPPRTFMPRPETMRESRYQLSR